MMTAYLSAPYQPVSALTVQSFRDLGYTVDGSAADTFNTSQTGYDTPNVPYSENPAQPNWYNINNNGFWTSTAIWIISCVGIALVVIILSIIYNRCRARQLGKVGRRPPQPPTVMRSSRPNTVPPAYIPAAQPIYSDPIPIATAVPVNPASAPVYEAARVVGPAYPSIRAGASDPQVNLFMEVTQCRNPSTAASFLRSAGGNVSLAIDQYLERQGRQMEPV